MGARDDDLWDVAAAPHTHGPSMSVDLDASIHNEQNNYDMDLDIEARSTMLKITTNSIKSMSNTISI